MPNAREQRFEWICATFNQLPGWLWWPLLPWLYPAYLVIVWPVLMMFSAAIMAGTLLYLRLNFLGDEITWASIGLMAIFPLLGSLVLGYLILAVFAIGSVPLAIVVGFRQWREGRPFRLIDPPVPDSFRSSRRELRAKLREGKGLTRSDLEMIVTVDEVVDLRLQTLLRASFSLMVGSVVVLAVAWLLFGFDYKAVVAPLFLVWFTSLFPIIYLSEETIRSDLLRCRHCGRILAGKFLKRVLDADQCPRCSGPEPLAPKPSASVESPLCDSEVP